MYNKCEKIRDFINNNITRVEKLLLLIDHADIVVNKCLNSEEVSSDHDKEPPVAQQDEEIVDEGNLSYLNERLEKLITEHPKAKRGRQFKNDGYRIMPDGTTAEYHSAEEKKVVTKLYQQMYRMQRKEKADKQKKEREARIEAAIEVPSVEDHLLCIIDDLDRFHELVKQKKYFRDALIEFFEAQSKEEIDRLVEVAKQIAENLDDYGLTRDDNKTIVVKEGD